jgi:hypothetical protein
MPEARRRAVARAALVHALAWGLFAGACFVLRVLWPAGG